MRESSMQSAAVTGKADHGKAQTDESGEAEGNGR